MSILATGGKVHWNYFIALEKDLEVVSRYIEFADENMGVFSLELAHLLMTASSEVDVLAKLVCERLEPGQGSRNIDQYRAILKRHLPELVDMRVSIARYGLELKPWDNWSQEDLNPDWWRCYNNVKHERNAYYQQATLQNALNSMAALLCLLFHYYRFDVPEEPLGTRAQRTMLDLKPDSALLELVGDYYFAYMVG